MQKILFGIFAHPDDEAFGPAATLLTETQNGTELHLITFTAGESGTNPDNLPNLGEVRLQEWHAAGELLGAKTMRHLGYIDGTLNNIDHLAITNQVIDIVKEIAAGRDDIEIEFMSLDLNGFSGHIDHIVASRSACLAFYRLRDAGLPMKRVRLACWSHIDHATLNTDFVLMEPGHQDNEIDETVDNRQSIDKVREIMLIHHTQRNDYEMMTTKLGENIAVNHFIVKD